jgi:hypothetical protein
VVPPAACNVTAASTAAPASAIHLQRSSGDKASLRFLEDGVLRFDGVQCLEATLCNTCGIVTSEFAALKAEVQELKDAMAATTTQVETLSGAVSVFTGRCTTAEENNVVSSTATQLSGLACMFTGAQAMVMC